jgi:hypothetical protein
LLTRPRFNVAQRLGGSVGVALIGTFFAVSEMSRVTRVLHDLGIRVSGLSSETGMSGLPTALQSRLADAAAARADELAQELEPELVVLSRSDIDADDLALARGANSDRDQNRHRDHPARSL